MFIVLFIKYIHVFVRSKSIIRFYFINGNISVSNLKHIHLLTLNKRPNRSVSLNRILSYIPI